MHNVIEKTPLTAVFYLFFKYFTKFEIFESNSKLYKMFSLQYIFEEVVHSKELL